MGSPSRKNRKRILFIYKVCPGNGYRYQLLVVIVKGDVVPSPAMPKFQEAVLSGEEWMKRMDDMKALLQLGRRRCSA